MGRRSSRAAVPIAAGLLLSACWAIPAAARPTVEAPPVTDTGHFSLRWDSDLEEPVQFIVQRAGDEAFTDPEVLYEGGDRATTLSGLLNGVHYFRVHDGDAWSEPVRVEVMHHSVAKAIFFLSIGALVFLATGAIVVSGHIAHRRSGAGTGEA